MLQILKIRSYLNILPLSFFNTLVCYIFGTLILKPWLMTWPSVVTLVTVHNCGFINPRLWAGVSICVAACAYVQVC